MAERQNTFTVFIDPRYSARQRRSIGIDIVNHIVNRAENKRGSTGRFKNYEDSYVAHTDFKAAGKSKTNPNLTLTGSMLNDLRVMDITLPGRIIVGFKRNSKSNDKSVWVEEKGFRFLSISTSELNNILIKYPLLDQSEILRQVAAQRENEDGN